MAKNFADERGYGTQVFDYLFHGSSPSEYRGAHQDIDKLIANADANSILSQLFKMKVGRENIGVYRHLAPDSTVSILMGLQDEYYRNEHIPISDLLYENALSRVDSPISQKEAARMLSQKRNQ